MVVVVGKGVGFWSKFSKLKEIIVWVIFEYPPMSQSIFDTVLYYGLFPSFLRSFLSTFLKCKEDQYIWEIIVSNLTNVRKVTA